MYTFYYEIFETDAEYFPQCIGQTNCVKSHLNNWPHLIFKNVTQKAS